MQGRTETETWRTDALMQAGGEGVRMHWEAETPTHTLPCVNTSLVEAAALHRGAQLGALG